ncbi:Variant-specific surface protein, partial [Giardia duodenalis]
VKRHVKLKMCLLTLTIFFAGILGINCPRDHYALGNMCIKCEDGMLWCVSCKGPGKCTECREGYYLDGGYCKPCDHTCKTCNNPHTCLECSTNHCRNASGACVEPEDVYDGCGKCAHDTNKCIKCHEGYFFNAKTFTCIKCKENCYTCKNETECEEPSSGYHLDNSTGAITRCEDTNCKICDESISTCDECVDGYTLNGGGSSSSCTPCNDKHCSECASASTCSGCKEGYVLTGSVCSPCGTNCYFCMDGTYPSPYRCVSGACMPGYRFDPNSFYCAECPEGCISCYYDSLRAETICDRCKTTTDAVTGPNIYGILCTASPQGPCFKGQFLENGECISCEVSVMGCEECSERYQCTKCLEGFYLVGNICVACDSTCDTCEGTNSNCTGCPSGKALKGNACVSAGEVIPNCEETMSGTGELACATCSPGYYSSEGTCEACFNQCKDCLGPELADCIRAADGYRYDRQNQRIEKCSVDNCSMCPSAAGTCTKCNDGYYLSTDGSRCTKGSTVNCRDYVNGQDKCVRCEDGYGFSEGADPTCIPCQKECLGGCYFANLCPHGNCADGFYFSQKDSTCTACPSGCSMCKQFWNNKLLGCTRCASGDTVSLSTAYGLHCDGLPNKSGLKPGVTAAIVILVLLLIGVCAAMPFIVKVLVRKGVRRKTRAMKYDRGSADSLLPEGSADSAI